MPEGPPGPKNVLEAARRLLSGRDHGRAELQRKLQVRGFTPSQITGALERFEADGLLNDAKCARALLEVELGRGHGLAYIRAKLRQRGLPPGEEPAHREAEAESLRQFLRRRNLVPRALTEVRERAKILRFLRGRGYTAAAIAAVLGPLAEEGRD
jgi:regulatory protein